MCLDRCLPLEYMPKQDFGWKVIQKNDDNVPTTVIMDTPVVFNNWIKDIKNEFLITEAEPYQKYHTGFHIFLDKISAMKYISCYDEIIVKVKFKEVLAYGLSVGQRVVVAKQIFYTEDE